MSATSFPTSCKAVVIHDAGQATLEEVAVPRPDPDDVVIQVAYVGVCATDLEILDGTLGYYRNRIAHYPIVPGHEISGTVISAGSKVREVKAGDPVVVECIHGCGNCDACVADDPISCSRRAELGVIGLNGGYSEFLVVPARAVHKIPAGIDLHTACLCEPLAVALKGLNRLGRVWRRAQTRECAVVGAGPLGRLCAMVLAHRGHSVTLFDREPRRLADCNEVSTAPALQDLSAYETIVEATGDQEALEVVLNTSRTGVSILLLGLPYAKSSFCFENLVAYDKTIVGSVGSSSADFENALALLPSLDTSAFATPVLPLEQFEYGWQLARERAHLKITLNPNGRVSNAA